MPEPTTPDADLRERIAERLASWGIAYVPQRSDDPIYDRLADRVMADVVTPELERRDAELAQVVEDYGRNDEQTLADSAKLAAELHHKTSDWQTLLKECSAVRQALIKGGHGVHGTEDAAEAVAKLIARLRAAEAESPSGLTWHANHIPPGTTDRKDPDAPIPAGWWVTGHDPEQPDGPVVQMLVESTVFRLVEEDEAGEWAQRVAQALNGVASESVPPAPAAPPAAASADTTPDRDDECGATEGMTGIECDRYPGHQDWHSGKHTPRTDGTESVGYPVRIQWPRMDYDRCASASNIFREGDREPKADVRAVCGGRTGRTYTRGSEHFGGPWNYETPDGGAWDIWAAVLRAEWSVEVLPTTEQEAEK